MQKRDWAHHTDAELAPLIEAQAVANWEEWQPIPLGNGAMSREDIFVRPAGSVLSVWRRVNLTDFLAGK